MADDIRPPWTPEQVRAINAYQAREDQPLICSYTKRRHGGLYVALIARSDGMHCSDPRCDYRQGWARAYMAEPQPLSGWLADFAARHTTPAT